MDATPPAVAVEIPFDGPGSAGPQSTGPHRHRRRWRALGWVLLGLLLFAGVLAGGLVWVLRPEALRQRLETELSARLGGPVQVGALAYTWRDEVTLELRGLVLPLSPSGDSAAVAAGTSPRPGSLRLGMLRIGTLHLRTRLGWRGALHAAWAARQGGAVELASAEIRDIRWQPTSGRAWQVDHVRLLRLRKAAAGEEKVSAAAVEATFGTATVRLAYPAWTPTVTQFVVQVVPLNLRELLPQWGMAVPPTTADSAFTRVGLQAACRMTPREWACGTLQMQLDDTRLEGSVIREMGSTGAWHFTLQADRLNLDGYLPPDDPREPPLQVPWELANAWPVDGTLQVAELRLGGLRLKEANLEVRFGANGLVVQ